MVMNKLPSPHCTNMVLLVGLISVKAAITLAYASLGYADALDKTLLFFEAQRSGKLPAQQRVKWRHDSALGDGRAEGVDLVGGYYDAGDNVKFGLSMAFSVTMLCWAAIDFKDEFVSSNQLVNTLDAIKWGTDYFIKAHPDPNVLYGQVGDGRTDHKCWERPEDMTTSRTAYKIDSEHPGSDLAGETAAAMAAASLAFKDYNSTYSALLLKHAIELFAFANEYRGLYHDSIVSARDYYFSHGYNDELLWAAAWLYRATNDEEHLQYVVNNFETSAMKESSWDNKYAATQILLSNILLDGSAGGAYTSTLQQYEELANYFACACLQKNDVGSNVVITPGGLLYVRGWNNLEYATSAAFLLAVYSDYLTKANNAVVKCPNAQLQPSDLLDFAKSQADYILGNNPESMSYLVGYSDKYPVQVHHRGASILSIDVLQSTVTCSQGYGTWYSRPEANPNVVYGALVGGPNAKDEFTDDRSKFEQTEATISGTAPLVGVFAKLNTNPARSNYNQELAKTPAVPSKKQSKYKVKKAGVELTHSIAHTWTIVGMGTYYVHRVIARNVNQMSITGMKLKVENLKSFRHIWGLNRTLEKNIFEFKRVLKSGSSCNFVYVQGGPQAKFSVQSYTTN